MQGGRDPFGGFGDPFGGFDGHRSFVASFFGGRDPFDDAFFTRPFGNMFGSSVFGPGRSPFESSIFGPGQSLFESSIFGSNRNPFESSFLGPMNPFMETQTPLFLEHQPSRPPRSTGPIIEELDSDDEKEEEKADTKKENPRKHHRSTDKPFVEHPDDAAEERRIKLRNDFNRASIPSQPHSHTFTFQSSTVSYGGVNGVQYASSTMRRSGSDGLTFKESREANSATGQATHKISRGLQNKGHSVTRKLNSDGRVDMMQTLHNLNEDELAGFEETWKGNARRHLPGWSDGMSAPADIGSGSSTRNPPSRGGWALPSAERPSQSRSTRPELKEATDHPHSHHAAKKASFGDKTGSSSGCGTKPSDTN